MKIVFFGTPDYVVPVLDTLYKEFKPVAGKSAVTAVVTQNPKPQGRKKELAYSPVDTWAHKKGIEKFFDPTDLLKNKVQADLGILASYGAIIPSEVIRLFPHGILNIHPSILPDWRGSAPVQATIISEDQAGATIIKIDEKLDHGPIISQFKDEVLAEDTTESLRERLFKRSAEVLAELIPAYLAGKITPRKQDHSKATFTREIKKDDAFIPPKYLDAILKGFPLTGRWKINFMKNYSLVPSAYTLNSFIRAMQPWPGAWTFVQKGQSAKDKEQKRLKIIKAHLESTTSNKLVLDIVQLEGKTTVAWKQFKEGYKADF
jgi:methionyl-tRNA formyltransferase